MNHIRSLWADSSALLKKIREMGIDSESICDDSREVNPGDIFLAYPGDFADGRQFIADAIARGASSVLWESDGDGEAFSWNEAWQVANLPVSNLRSYCGPLAHAILGFPAERLSVIAATGTNGKTTITQWIGALYPAKCGIVGTLGAGYKNDLVDTGLTTPGAVGLARYLARFCEEEAKACALEASSIGIEEGRMDGLKADVAIFTNLTRDHLDYHQSMANYAKAKKKLFAWPSLRLAVINIDDPFGEELAGSAEASKILVYSQQQTSHSSHAIVYAKEIEETIRGLRFTLCAPNGRAQVETRLIGRFNISNLLAVAAVLIDAGLSPSQIAKRFATLDAPPGRLEQIGGHHEPLVVIDYSHTPDSLENALTALRGVARARGGRLAVVFGCGGNRDPGKRPLMGAVASSLADKVVITSDNPRRENPLEIIEEIRPGAPDALVIADRALAIAKTIGEAHPAEVILLAGKGHEPYQEIMGERLPFSDIEEARRALLARKEAQL